MKTIQEIAEIFNVNPDDVAVRTEKFATHLCVNQVSLCGQLNNNKYPELAGIKMSTHSDTFGQYGVICKSCDKHLEKKISKELSEYTITAKLLNTYEIKVMATDSASALASLDEWLAEDFTDFMTNQQWDMEAI